MKRPVMTVFLLAALLAGAGEPRFRLAAPLRTSADVEATEAPIPIPAGRKLHLAFTARTDSRYTIEADERIRLMDLSRVGSRVRLDFLDDTGAVVAGGFDVFILTQATHHYARVFHPPAQAAACRLSVRPGPGAEVVIEELTLDESLPPGEQESINPHPTFEHGDLNSYGCQSGFGGQFYTRPDGVTVWKTGFLGYSPAFPVEAGRFYTFQCRGRQYRGRKSYILLDCHNATERAPIKTMRLDMSDDGRTTELQMPEGAVEARLRAYCVILETFRVTPSPQAPPHD